MKTLKCNYCHREFDVDETNVSKTSKYIQCPYCQDNTQLNPFYEGENGAD